MQSMYISGGMNSVQSPTKHEIVFDPSVSVSKDHIFVPKTRKHTYTHMPHLLLYHSEYIIIDQTYLHFKIMTRLVKKARCDFSKFIVRITKQQYSCLNDLIFYFFKPLGAGEASDYFCG